MIFENHSLRLAILHALDDVLTILEGNKFNKTSNKFLTSQESMILSEKLIIQYAKCLTQRMLSLVCVEEYFKFQEIIIIACSQKYFTISQLIIAYEELCKLSETINVKFGLKNDCKKYTQNGNRNYIEIETISESKFKVTFSGDLFSYFEVVDTKAAYIDCVIQMWNLILKEERRPTNKESLALQLAYNLLCLDPMAHYALSAKYKSSGVPGFRSKNQTFVSIMYNEGYDNFGITQQLKWMQDLYINIGNLEKPKSLQVNEFESCTCKIPSLRNFNKIRLHSNSVIPNTFYIGRILYDTGHFESDLVKIVKTFASAINYVFLIGTAECQISMENLTTYEAVRLMRQLKAEIVKKDDQVLSAIWHLNNELIDDLEEEEGGEIFRKQQGSIFTENYDIAKVAIMITAMSGFEKITWTGTSNKSESIVTFQLSLSQVFTLVHYAHSLGLLTCLTCEFTYDEIKLAVFSGIDCIHISEVNDNDLSRHKLRIEENLDVILNKRDEASQSFYGKAVKMMCKLDSMFNEGSLNINENKLREKLFNELNNRFDNFKFNRNAQEYEILLYEVNRNIFELLDSLKNIINIRINEKWSKGKQIAERILNTENPLLFYYADSNETWLDAIHQLEIIASDRDKQVDTFYYEYPWSNYFRQHKEKIFNQLCKKYLNKRLFS